MELPPIFSIVRTALKDNKMEVFNITFGILLRIYKIKFIVIAYVWAALFWGVSALHFFSGLFYKQ